MWSQVPGRFKSPAGTRGRQRRSPSSQMPEGSPVTADSYQGGFPGSPGAAWNGLGPGAMTGYSWSMAKDQNKKRTAKTNKPKLTAKEKKLKKLAKKGK